MKNILISHDVIYSKKVPLFQKFTQKKQMNFINELINNFITFKMKRESQKRLGLHREGKQILPHVSPTKLKADNFLNISIICQERPNEINIPINIKKQSSQIQIVQHPSDFKNNRTNIRQLNNFLKHQALIIKQKERIITNIAPKTRQEMNLKQIRQKMVRILSLKSSIKIDSSQTMEDPFRKLNKIQLPQMEDIIKRARSLKIRKYTVSVLGNQNRLKNNSVINKYALLNKKNVKNFPNKSKICLHEQPLIIASSKKLSELGLNPQTNTKRRQDTSQIVDFKRFKNHSRLSKLSLRLITEFTQDKSRTIQRHLSYSP